MPSSTSARSDETKHRAVYARLREDILSGRYAPGDKLPSSRELAAAVGCARNTAVQAYERLLAHGYVETRHGSGTFVTRAADPAAEPGKGQEARLPQTELARLAQRFRASRQHARALVPQNPRVNFQYGAVQLDQAFSRVWQRLVTREAGALPTEYQEPEGTPRLRRALADYLRRRRRMVVDPDQVIVTSGSQQALDLIARTTLDRHRRAVIEEPGYPGARVAFQASGAEVATCPVDHAGLCVESLPDRADLAYVTPSHQFPTGAVLPVGRRLELLRWAERAGAFVFEDDYDSEFRHAGPPLETLQSLDDTGRVVYCGTFSKIISPALRVGFLVVPEALVDSVRAVKWITDRSSGDMAQNALAALIEDGHLERFIRRAGRRLTGRCNTLTRGLKQRFGATVEISGSHTGMHIVVQFPGLPAARTDDLVRAAGEEGIAVYPATLYRSDPDQGCAGMMLGYATVSRAEIEVALPALERAWGGMLSE